MRFSMATGLVALLVAGCGSIPSGATSQQGQESQSPQPSAVAESKPVLVVQPSVANGTKNVPVDTLVSVGADHGKLDTVKVTGKGEDRDGNPATFEVPGALGADGRWQATSRLEPDATYTVEASGTGEDGKAVSSTSSFQTAKLSLKQQAFPTVQPLPNTTVGMAMPVIVKFDVPITDKAEFQRHMKVTTVPEQEGTWGWVSDNEAHWRPKEYWQAGTRVSLNADLNGVNAGNGVYGQESRSTQFTVGKQQLINVDLKSHELTQTVNGQVTKKIPISAGKPGFTTRSGTKVITEKLDSTKMDSETTGISRNSSEGYSMIVKWAMRITDSGEFLHAAPWNAGYFGASNESHGCVGMSTSNASSLFSATQVGDPVVVTGSQRKLEDDNGITDWNISYDQFKAKSAF